MIFRLATILQLVFAVCIVGFLWPYLFYPLTILFLSKVIKRGHKGEENHIEDITIIIPCYNEEKIIESKLMNTLELDYPKERRRIIVVDDGSTDRTAEIVRKYGEKGVELIIQNRRMGKAAALNLAVSRTSTEVVVTTDADTYLSKGALKHLIRHFFDSKIGVVGGTSFVKKSELPTEVEGFDIFARFEDFLEKKESYVDSSVNLGGQLMAIRKDLAIFDELSLAEDFDCILRARTNGYRIILEPNARAVEYSPITERDVLVHQKRISIGTIQTLVNYRKVLFNRRYGIFGFAILPGHRVSQIVNCWFLLSAVLCSYIAFFLTYSVFYFYFVVLESLLILMAFLSVTLKLRIKPFGYINYFVLVQYGLLSAWLSYAKGHYTVKWEKMESNRSNGIPHK